MRRRKMIFILIFAGLGTVFVCVALWNLVWLLINITPERMLSAAEQMAMIQSETALSFPTDARVEHFSDYEKSIEPVWAAKVIVPASFYENLKQDLLARPDQQSHKSGNFPESTGWWKPSNVILTKQYMADSQTFVKVIVSKENEELAVYIECAVL